jgi:6-pyruvoyltetrahydropterin/6-carboxytetrahydropterin synthase
MSMRGIQKTGATTVTSCMLGLFRDDLRTRNEFVTLLSIPPLGGQTDNRQSSLAALDAGNLGSSADPEVQVACCPHHETAASEAPPPASGLVGEATATAQVQPICTIKLFKEDMKFSSGHFTIFSDTERERVHGHNFTVQCELDAPVENDGMVSDYNEFKTVIRRLCAEWDEFLLVPTRSPHVDVKLVTVVGSAAEDATPAPPDRRCVKIMFNGEEIVLPEGDVKLLPVANITVEELSALLVSKVAAEFQGICSSVSRVSVTVSSGPGDSGTSERRS